MTDKLQHYCNREVEYKRFIIHLNFWRGGGTGPHQCSSPAGGGTRVKQTPRGRQPLWPAQSTLQLVLQACAPSAPLENPACTKQIQLIRPGSTYFHVIGQLAVCMQPSEPTLSTDPMTPKHLSYSRCLSYFSVTALQIWWTLVSNVALGCQGCSTYPSCIANVSQPPPFQHHSPVLAVHLPVLHNKHVHQKLASRFKQFKASTSPSYSLALQPFTFPPLVYLVTKVCSATLFRLLRIYKRTSAKHASTK